MKSKSTWLFPADVKASESKHVGNVKSQLLLAYSSHVWALPTFFPKRIFCFQGSKQQTVLLRTELPSTKQLYKHLAASSFNLDFPDVKI